MSHQRIGTIACLLFGHKFIALSNYWDQQMGVMNRMYVASFCQRCGAPRQVEDGKPEEK